MKFEILKKSKKSGARLGVVKTAHGELKTPAFFPVATQAAVKTLDSQDLKTIGFEGILANTYHLSLRPGEKIIKKAGGLHNFMNWNGVIATDSGGFQVFSLGKGITHKTGKIFKTDSRSFKSLKEPSKKAFVKITEDGVFFKSHLDGSNLFLSPESSMQIQQELGADIIFAFDEPSSPKDTKEQARQAMERTHRWAERCLWRQKIKTKKQKSKLKQQGLFGIIQGGKYMSLRKESAKFIGSLDFEGFGIGGSFGSSYGDSKKNMLDVLNIVIPLLPEERPRHLLGIGHLNDIEAAVKSGVDLFDCVHPTRVARHGLAITSQGEINILKTKFLNDLSPLDKKCGCFVCKNYSKAYLCHLFKAQETTGQRLLTFHNLWFFKKFVDNIREKVANNKI